MKRSHLFALLALLILAALISTSDQSLVWGPTTLSSADEVRHLARTSQIIQGNIDMLHEWDNPKYFDFYPSGFHVLLQVVFVSSGVLNTYLVTFVMKLALNIAVTILYFLLGNQIDPRVGLAAAFFKITLFQVVTSSDSFYVYLNSTQIYLGTGLLSEVLTLPVILFIVRGVIRKRLTGGEKLVLFLILSVHGASHVSVFVTSVGVFSIALLGFTTLTFRKRKWSWNLTANAVWEIMTVLVLSLIGAYLLYYHWIASSGSLRDYDFSSIIPEWISPQAIAGIDFVLAIFGILGIVTVFYLSFRKTQTVGTGIQRIDQTLALLMVPAFLFAYVLLVIVTTYDPASFRTTYILLAGIFPTYIPTHPNLVSLLSIVAGFALLGITLLGLFALARASTLATRFFSVFFVLSYAGWMLFAFVIGYNPDRAIYVVMYQVPVVLGFALVSMTRPRRSRGVSKARRVLKVIPVSVIVVGMLLVNVVTQANSETIISPTVETQNVLRFGSVSPPTTTSGFVVAVDSYLGNSGYALGSKRTLQALAATANVRTPPSTYSLLHDNSDYSLTASALQGEKLAEFAEKYGTTWIIVSYSDVEMENEMSGNPEVWTSNLSSRSDIYSVYVDGYAQRIFFYIG